MRHYPINLNLKGRLVVVVGGGKVAARKAARLVGAGARVTVVAPVVEESLAALVAHGGVAHLCRSYRSGDISGAILVFAATSDPAVNREVAREARELNILVDCVDLPGDGDFVTPAVLEQGGLLITVSTGGASPSLSKSIVERLRPQFGPEYGEAVALLDAVREKLLTEKVGNAYNDTVFAELAALDLPALIKNGQRDAIDQILLKLSAAGAAPGPAGAGKEDPS
ncbi:precorrin-2 dehydrogenase/sirohydrochlorin ferrochelatase family protein [Geomonas subterranea]|uniref:precorrin-2 dehydrogenase n=1 Tax=Geomonas subterranea TaxID=2847989 RepID=A0ABX8LC57_9BACT|nr:MULTISPECIES: bifunctional precorrin-2 dehydrogenase/sirohydrochlorin ferrochelatase [Geomonas]QXE89598.1 bifunctional precorrin-2 dehydrogenase/sirohydrochlorin ferrochelatase [Geomonas subterranea]QXM08286.1 bifunctional precorrin-2 dehydrogenase/sirohydrochlorin ferrochelatase [Geomonas subterranea]